MNAPGHGNATASERTAPLAALTLGCFVQPPTVRFSQRLLVLHKKPQRSHIVSPSAVARFSRGLNWADSQGRCFIIPCGSFIMKEIRKLSGTVCLPFLLLTTHRI